MEKIKVLSSLLLTILSLIATAQVQSTLFGQGALGTYYKANGNYAVQIGYQAGWQGTTSSHRNVFIGHKSGYTNKGSGNIFIGYTAGYYSGTTSNKLFIDNSSTNAPLIWGDFTTGVRKVKINGSLEVTNGITGSGFNTTNWNTAYSWGNHASAGYYKSGNSVTFATITASGNRRRTSHHTGHLEGSYNNVGANSFNSNPIYTIGSSYNPSSTSLSNMYGVGYTHRNASFVNSTDLGVEPTNGWGAYVAADGNARIFFDASSGHGFFKGNLYNQNVYARGSITASGGNSGNWNTAYTERGSQIAGTGLTWSNGKLNAVAYNPATIITNYNQWNPDASGNTVFSYDDANPTYNGKYVGAVINIRGDGVQDAALVRSGAYHADHFQASNGFFVGSSQTNGTRIIDASGNINTPGTIIGSNLNIGNWNTAYSERGSQIAGTGLNWSGGQLNIVNVNTDNQDLELSGNSLSLTNDPTPVDLTGYLDNTDNQDLSIAGNILSLTNDATTVDLAGYLDNTDSQSLSLVGSDLSITGGNTIDISSIDTDTQLSDADITAMGYIKTETDNQDLSIAGNILSLTNDATSVDLSTYLDNTDSQTALEVNFISTSGLVATEVAGALDEINTRINNNASSLWTENTGNISFSTGQVSIGTTETKNGYELSVAGEIVAEEILIEYQSEWPDYVFNDSYNLLSIIDLKEFIKKNRHLPNVPSEKEVKENGIEVGEMNKILLEKIEELTLYMIRQSEEIESLKEQVKELKNNQ